MESSEQAKRVISPPVASNQLLHIDLLINLSSLMYPKILFSSSFCIFVILDASANIAIYMKNIIKDKRKLEKKSEE